MKADLPTLPGVGASALEVSHRGAWFEGVIEEAEANLRALLKIGDDHRVLFCQGGASMQFAMVPMNLLRDGAAADLVVTGSWGAKAATEAARVGRARIAWSGEDGSFVRVPTDEELLGALDPAAAYVHLTTNETIQGVEFPATPALPDEVVLAADHSSDFLSRPVDVARYGVLYAGAQKNAGPAGVTIVVIRDDVLARIPDGLPTMLDYRTYAEHGSMYNTPPVFAIYVVLLVTRWLRDEIGGLDAMAGEQPGEGRPAVRRDRRTPGRLPGSRGARVALGDERHVPAADARGRACVPRRRRPTRAWSSSAAIAASAGSARRSTTRCRWKGSRRSPSSCDGSPGADRAARGQPTVVMSNSLPSGSWTVRQRYSSSVCSPPGHDPPSSAMRAVVASRSSTSKSRCIRFLAVFCLVDTLQAERRQVVPVADEDEAPVVHRLARRALEQRGPEGRHAIDVDAIQRDEREPQLRHP